jgi:hypothetical protein
MSGPQLEVFLDLGSQYSRNAIGEPVLVGGLPSLLDQGSNPHGCMRRSSARFMGFRP